MQILNQFIIFFSGTYVVNNMPYGLTVRRAKIGYESLLYHEAQVIKSLGTLQQNTFISIECVTKVHFFLFVEMLRREKSLPTSYFL